MPYKLKPSVVAQRLKRVLQAKIAAVRKLEQEREQLLQRHALLRSTCEVLDAVRQSARASTVLMSEAEALLLQQLGPDGPAAGPKIGTNGNSDASGSSSSYRFDCEAAAASAGGEATIAPIEYPLHMMTPHLLPQQQQGTMPLLDPETVTLTQLQADYVHTVNQLAANVSLLDSPSLYGNYSSSSSSSSSNAEHGAGPLRTVQQLLCRQWRILDQLLACGRGELTVQFMLSNAVTGQPHKVHDKELYTYTLAQLNLSSQQKQRMVATFHQFKQLLEKVTKEWQQAQLPACTSSSSSSSSSDSDSAAAAAAANDDPFKYKRVVLMQQEQLRQQQQHKQQQVALLNVLLRKEFLIKYLSGMALQGHLTWKQMATFMLATFPCPPSPKALVQAVESEMAAATAAAAHGSKLWV